MKSQELSSKDDNGRVYKTQVSRAMEAVEFTKI